MSKTRQVSATFSHRIAPKKGDLFLEYVCRRFPYHNSSEWLLRIQNGSVQINGQTVAPDTILYPKMHMQYRVVDYEEPIVPIHFHELIQRGDLALVHKPAGLPVHKTGKIFVNTLANLYRQKRQDENWSPLHRLDVESSGIVAFARGSYALRCFAPTAPEIRWSKLYLAIVNGNPPESGTLDQTLGPQLGDPIRSRMQHSVLGKPALTHFRKLFQDNLGHVLLLVKPITGRKHQIRAHCAIAGFPIVGDKTYSLEGQFYLKRLHSDLNEKDFQQLESDHHLLHAWSLKIETSSGIAIEGQDSELPEKFFEFFPALREFLAGNHFSNILY